MWQASHSAADPHCKHLQESGSKWADRRQRFFLITRPLQKGKARVLPLGIRIDLGVWCFNEPGVWMICCCCICSKNLICLFFLCIFSGWILSWLGGRFKTFQTDQDVKDLQSSQGREEIGYRQCNPGYSEVRTGCPWTSARPHSGTGKITPDFTSCSICSLWVITSINLIEGAVLHFINRPSEHSTH